MLGLQLGHPLLAQRLQLLVRHRLAGRETGRSSPAAREGDGEEAAAPTAPAASLTPLSLSRAAFFAPARGRLLLGLESRVPSERASERARHGPSGSVS